jgi:predicted RNA-binding Zn-ribbon protein involved in translation (DUF1610 family)
MKSCPNCGKDITDYAKKCKYCDYDIPTYEPVGGQDPIILSCPACGGGLNFDAISSTAECSHCGSKVVVPSRLRPLEEGVRLDKRTIPLSEQVEQLVKNNKLTQAVELLRSNLSLLKGNAERVVAIIESGEYGDAKQLLIDALYGKLK